MAEIPRMEIVAGDFLRSHPAIVALAARVAGKTPSDPSDPWIRVTQLDAANTGRSIPEHLMNYLVQFDCIAGRDASRAGNAQFEVTDLAYATRAALHDDFPGLRPGGVVVTCVEFTQMARIPDGDFEPARERFVLTAQIYAHA